MKRKRASWEVAGESMSDMDFLRLLRKKSSELKLFPTWKQRGQAECAAKRQEKRRRDLLQDLEPIESDDHLTWDEAKRELGIC